MGDRHVVSIRFHTEGLEEDLYQRMQEEKEKTGLSMPEYVKNILSEYFRDMEKRNGT